MEKMKRKERQGSTSRKVYKDMYIKEVGESETVKEEGSEQACVNG